MTRAFNKSAMKHAMQAEIEQLWAALLWVRDVEPTLVDNAIKKFKLGREAHGKLRARNQVTGEYKIF